MPAAPASVVSKPELTPRRKKGRSHPATEPSLSPEPKARRSPQRQREQLSDWNHAS
ncbi:MAG: hypothetical protein NW224_29415 [Leptolyngbyaceae cyanobacterium bins.302]|nr:hypothetical protein [Leptolyngbyaceae cyanobacterium bins.302]